MASLVFALPVALGAGVLVWAVASRQPPERVAIAEAVTTVRVITVVPQTFAPRVTAFGVVEPERVWTVSTQVAGRVAWTSSDFVRGGVVAAGDPVLRIATDDYRIALAQASAQTAALDARLAELALVLENATSSLAIEEEALALSERELARQVALVERGAAPAATLESQRRQTLTQWARVQDLRNQIALHPDQRRALEQERAAARAALERAQFDLDRTEVRAPFAARVADVAVEVGQFAPSGAALGRLDGVEAAEIDAQAPQAAMRAFVRTVFGAGAATDPRVLSDEDRRRRLTAEVRLRVGDDVVVWPARVARPSPALDPETRAFGVIVSVADPLDADPVLGRPPLTPGLFVEVAIAGPAVPDAILIPRGAVRGGAVFVADADDRLRRVPIEIAMAVDDVVLVAAGVEAGARVVLTDLPAAVEGRKLRAIEDAAAAARLAASATGGKR